MRCSMVWRSRRAMTSMNSARQVASSPGRSIIASFCSASASSRPANCSISDAVVMSGRLWTMAISSTSSGIPGWRRAVKRYGPGRSSASAGRCSSSRMAVRTKLRRGALTGRPECARCAGTWVSGPLARAPTPVSSVRRWRIRSPKAPSGIFSSCGRARSAIRALPSSEPRLMPSPTVSKKNSDSGVAAARRASKPACPSARTSESGSSPSGTNRKNAWRPSRMRGSTDSIALTAARRPAASPSKQKYTSGALRNRSSAWSGVVAVPSVATAWVTPCWNRAITSM